MITRFTSRSAPLHRAFLAERLKGATSYLRIAGYFRSSILELVGEEVAAIPDVRIVCNSDLDAGDLAVSKAARGVALKGKFNEGNDAAEALLDRSRYRKLYDLLLSKRVSIRVLPREAVFLHGKAGVIHRPTELGGSTSFLGSTNETRNAWAHNHELLWEDGSPEAVAWVEEEFAALWEQAFDLPDAILEEVGRVADRREVRFDPAAAARGEAGTIGEKEVPEAAMAEAPIYRNGEQLQPWQRSFVTTFLAHREAYGNARLLLADEVGLGKTLSLATAAMVAALLGDGPVLVLAPATLLWQWQVELKDRLGIPSAVWESSKKRWVDAEGHVIRTRGAGDVAHPPCAVAIVSTGLITQHTAERDALARVKLGTLVLDEAHKARTQGGLGKEEKPGRLLAFMRIAAANARHVLLGTATPIQTRVGDLWDLLSILDVNQARPRRSLAACRGRAGPRTPTPPALPGADSSFGWAS